MHLIIFTAKFDGSVPGIIYTVEEQHTTNEKTTGITSVSALATSTGSDATGSSIAVLDVATYGILAVAGFLILLFVIALIGTSLFFCCTKDKKRRY